MVGVLSCRSRVKMAYKRVERWYRIVHGWAVKQAVSPRPTLLLFHAQRHLRESSSVFPFFQFTVNNAQRQKFEIVFHFAWIKKYSAFSRQFFCGWRGVAAAEEKYICKKMLVSCSWQKCLTRVSKKIAGKHRSLFLSKIWRENAEVFVCHSCLWNFCVSPSNFWWMARDWWKRNKKRV